MTNVIVIGGGLGGLSAATHLARMGCKVTLLEKNAGTGGRANLIEQDGFRFDTGPSLLNYPWVFEQLFADNGSDLHEQLELLEVEPGIRFHWPDGESLQLSSRFDRLRSEFERFDPSVGPRLSAWLGLSSMEKVISQSMTRETACSAAWRARMGVIAASSPYRMKRSVGILSSAAAAPASTTSGP